ncbi:YdbL family protein [Candidatus Methylacidiphilum infernorum]|uniref:YdbL family protein n=1 Tax=Candidatus Methylacidiphilum infernorum TaxID=511746 RepID=A0ABX7PVR5_9BACT|nr:DUF1318 domain-containing protein [Candidatus Methylacidiphilum infernorum]QSR87081.1 YdbL family protein [Candidatus Methylacidiphilum infernorum]
MKKTFYCILKILLFCKLLKKERILILSFCAFGCSPTVKLTTPEPVKINVNMGVVVTEKESPNRITLDPQVADRRRLRSGEVQSLKNARVIGENREGYLEIINPPKEENYRNWAKKVVAEENEDRTKLYLTQAKIQGKPLEEIEREYAKKWQEMSFPGEYIQEYNGKWIQK